MASWYSVRLRNIFMELLFITNISWKVERDPKICCNVSLRQPPLPLVSFELLPLKYYVRKKGMRIWNTQKHYLVLDPCVNCRQIDKSNHQNNKVPVSPFQSQKRQTRWTHYYHGPPTNPFDLLYKIPSQSWWPRHNSENRVFSHGKLFFVQKKKNTGFLAPTGAQGVNQAGKHLGDIQSEPCPVGACYLLIIYFVFNP